MRECVIRNKQSSEEIWLSGKTLDCRTRDCEFDPPSIQLKQEGPEGPGLLT